VLLFSRVRVSDSWMCQQLRLKSFPSNTKLVIWLKRKSNTLPRIASIFKSVSKLYELWPAQNTSSFVCFFLWKEIVKESADKLLWLLLRQWTYDRTVRVGLPSNATVEKRFAQPVHTAFPCSHFFAVWNFWTMFRVSCGTSTLENFTTVCIEICCLTAHTHTHKPKHI
jgi:hypothetical protein